MTLPMQHLGQPPLCQWNAPLHGTVGACGQRPQFIGSYKAFNIAAPFWVNGKVKACTAKLQKKLHSQISAQNLKIGLHLRRWFWHRAGDFVHTVALPFCKGQCIYGLVTP